MSHVFQMVPVILVGLVSAVVTGVNIVQVAYGTEIRRQPGGEDAQLEMH